MFRSGREEGRVSSENHMFLHPPYTNLHLGQWSYRSLWRTVKENTWTIKQHQKVEEVNKVETNVSAKSFELLIPFLQV